jgi:hypothetical protein
MSNPYKLPNDDKNCRLEEFPQGLRLHYVLSCTPDHPYKTFQSKGKWYVDRFVDIHYQNNMSNVILHAYYYLKRKTMLELRLFKKQKLDAEIDQLTFKF